MYLALFSLCPLPSLPSLDICRSVSFGLVFLPGTILNPKPNSNRHLLLRQKCTGLDGVSLVQQTTCDKTQRQDQTKQHKATEHTTRRKIRPDQTT